MWIKSLIKYQYIPLAIAGGACVLFMILFLQIPREKKAVSGTLSLEHLSWPERSIILPAYWNVFNHAGTGSSIANPSSSLDKLLRLAGTFLYERGEADTYSSATRIAIVDDLEKKEQLMLSEGDEIAGATIQRIYNDRVLLYYNGKPVELWLSYLDETESVPERITANPESSEITEFGKIPAIEENRFGKRIEEDRWVLKKSVLKDYYQELAEDPERLANLYVSFKPTRDQQQNIQGYELDIIGEHDFLSNLGLTQNDVVRQVNSMKMTSQKRAEFFIGEFARDNLNALVLDIERDGEEKKLIYLIR